jgi:hypothetical protein
METPWAIVIDILGDHVMMRPHSDFDVRCLPTREISVSRSALVNHRFPAL